MGPNKTDDVLLVHDVAEEQDRLDDDEDCKMNGGQAGRHGRDLGALHNLLSRILCVKNKLSQLYCDPFY